jgi:hypothetical protein
VPRAGGQLVLVGGYTVDGPAPLRLLDAGCAADCVAKELDVVLGARLGSCAAFSSDPDHFILVGADQDQIVTVGSLVAPSTRTYAIDVIEQTAAELVLREPRAGAMATSAPTGMLALLGGVHPDGTGATTVELLDQAQ